MTKDMDRIINCFEKIQESSTNMNHNSTTTAKAMTQIARAVDKIEKAMAAGFGIVNNEHDNIKTKYDSTKLLFTWVIFPLICILGGLVGIKLVFP